MLRLFRRESPESWHQRHQQLAEFHRACRDTRGLEDQAGWADPVWQQHALEETYHRLCDAPRAHLTGALDQTLRAYEEQTTLVRRWVEMLQQAGADSDAPEVQQWGQRLLAVTMEPEDDWVGFLTLLTQDAGLSGDRRAAAVQARGIVHGQADRYELALADFDRALELRPDYEDALGGRGVTFRLMERYEDALADFTRVIDLDPNVARAFAHRGKTYRLMERYEDALADLTRAIDLDPNYAWAIADRGLTYRSMKRYEDALADLTRAIDLDPNYAWAIAGRGETYRLMKRYEDALADFTRAIDLDPNYAWAIIHRGGTYWRMGRYEEALADLTRAVELDPEDVRAIGGRGLTYRAMGRHEEALADLTHAIDLDPEEDWLRYELAVTYLQLGDHDNAQAALRHAIELGTQELSAKGATVRRLSNLALYHLAAGEVERSNGLWAQAFALPDATAYIRGTALDDLRDLKSALPDDATIDGCLRFMMDRFTTD